MAGKLFIVVFAFLAVQGWTSAGVIPDELADLFDSDDLLDVKALEDFSWEHLTKLEIESKNAENCVPYVPEAYKTAKVAQKLIAQAKALGEKLKEAAKKCKTLNDAEEKKKCYKAVQDQAVAEGKPISDAFKAIWPHVKKSMADFDKCMA